MGLIEQIQSGSRFTRKVVSISSTNPGTQGSVYLGASYILLNISSSQDCRVRLYGTSGSVSVDSARPSSSFDYSASVVLNLDSELTSGDRFLEFVPPIIATSHGGENNTWYNIQNSSTNELFITYYPIELNTSSRTFLNVPAYPGVNLTGYATSSGNISSPKSFLIIGAFSESSSVRLRLYSRPINDIPNSEKNRKFDTASATGSSIICDLLYDSASYLYRVTPVLQAYNLETYPVGSNQVGYILENTSPSAQSNIYASVQIYPLED